LQLTDRDALDAGKGTSNLSSGTFQDPGAINSNVQLNGATLTGLGAVHGTLDAHTGILSAGEPTGQLTAGPGDVTLMPGSTFNAVLVGPDQDNTQYNVLGGVGNVTIDNATLTFSVDTGYTPVHGDTFTVNKTDGTVTGTFTSGPGYTFDGTTLVVEYKPNSVVLVVDHPPVGTPGTLNSTENGGTVSGTLAATDAHGDTLTYAIATQASRGVVTLVNAATGAFTFTPNPNVEGADGFAFTANDGYTNSAPATVAINVVGAAEAPTLTVANASGNEFAAIPLNFQATLSEPAGLRP